MTIYRLKYIAYLKCENLRHDHKDVLSLSIPRETKMEACFVNVDRYTDEAL